MKKSSMPDVYSLLREAEKEPEKKRRDRKRKGRVFPPPAESSRLYVRIAPGLVHMFRFLLEAQDNLGIMTVVDRWGAVLLVRFSPHQERELRAFLDGMRGSVPFTVLSGTGP